MLDIKSQIEIKLNQSFDPIHLNVVNESFLHAVPKNAQTHFRIEIVCKEFEQKSLLQRHRLVQQLLANELSQIRACSLHTLTQQEWESAQGELMRSPTCAGGTKNPFKS